jgi:hypothetical protein
MGGQQRTVSASLPFEEAMINNKLCCSAQISVVTSYM